MAIVLRNQELLCQEIVTTAMLLSGKYTVDQLRDPAFTYLWLDEVEQMAEELFAKYDLEF